MQTIKQVRKTPAQKQAFDAYKNAERQFDRYMGSVFANAHGQRDAQYQAAAIVLASDGGGAVGLGFIHASLPLCFTDAAHSWTRWLVSKSIN